MDLSPTLRLAKGELEPGCPQRALLDHVTSKWGVLILVGLMGGSQRWGDLKRRLAGISEKMLGQTLKTLADDGLVHREAQPVVPPRVDYRLTERGEQVAGLLVPLLEWVMADAHGAASRAS